MWHNLFEISQNQTFETYRIFIFSARLTTLDRANAKVDRYVRLSVCMSRSQSIFTALHGMQTQYSDENSVRPSVCLSVCLSVRLSVWQTHDL